MGKWAFLLNRYIVTFGSIAIITAAWNIFIAFNDDGFIRGHVLAPDGRPVAGAEVILSERSLLVTSPRDQTQTDADGNFVFTGHKFHRVWIEAVKKGVGSFPQTEYRMYFKGQNMTLNEPLKLKAAPAETPPSDDFMPSESGGSG
jgi:Carboxypeptidase regulatory-like domain